jgi:hypothetical protein
MFGEKSSLNDVLGPLTREYKADLYLPTGEISDTLLHQMARSGAVDGRPMAILCFSDSDPAGRRMPVSIARKLQAFKALLFPDLEFEVHRVALTPAQVGVLNLPSTPLKDSERRADRWREAMGVEQTEIDGLAALQPDVLSGIARDALDAFRDRSLAGQVFKAEQASLGQAQTIPRSRGRTAGTGARPRPGPGTVGRDARRGPGDQRRAAHRR